MIVLPTEILQDSAGRTGHRSLRLRRRDGGQVYSAICLHENADVVSGTIHVVAPSQHVDVARIGQDDDEVRVIASRQKSGDKTAGGQDPKGFWQAKGFIRRQGRWVESPVELVPVREDLFSRTTGLLETAVFADKWVFIPGMGSGGAPTAMELAKIGINQIILDHDRLEVANVGRHVLGLSDVGRFKVNAMADALRDKNPYATIETCTQKITWDTQELVRDFVRRSDLTVCAVDGGAPRALLNKVCVEEGKPLIVAGAFRRAYGGQILFVRPHKGPCYQCFIQALPEAAADREISSEADAARIAYSDRPVAIEPGLSTDIAPISLMVTKLAIQYLLEDQDTTLRSLHEDLAAPWHLWLNRREAGTNYADLEPMAFGLDGLRVLRWYGLPMDRDPHCPCCGDFEAGLAEKEGFRVTQEDMAAFAGPETTA